jgi:transcriptional regulator with XRE-family HTH domain
MDGMSDITGEQIRAARERLRMTQQELAEELGVSLRTVSNWERGESVPRNRAGAIVDVLGIQEEVPEFGEKALLRRLGQLAKQQREILGMGRPSMAKEAGLGSDKTIIQFEFGRTLPRGTSQRRIEKALSWRIGAIDDVMRMVNRKASEIQMEDLDAEDSVYLASQGPKSLALYSDDDLIDELRRRLVAGRRVPYQSRQDLYDLAASTNSEHLEAEDDDHDGEQADS